MPYYESVFIARQDISGTQADSLAETFTNIIQEGGGQVTKKENWGLRNLQFRIKKNRKGHYVLLNIDGPSSAVLEMERNMRINEDVIRYLTVRVDELESEESIVLRSRGSRDSGRGGRRGGFDRGFDRGGFDRGDRGDRGGRGGRDRDARDGRDRDGRDRDGRDRDSRDRGGPARAGAADGAEAKTDGNAQKDAPTTEAGTKSEAGGEE